MKDAGGFHAALQGLIDCYLESNPREVLSSWTDINWKPKENVDIDETCLAYLALVILDALETRAGKIVLERGCPVLLIGSSGEHMLLASPEAPLARALEILRDLCGIKGAVSQGTLLLGVINDSIELRIEKSEAFISYGFNIFNRTGEPIPCHRP